MNQDTSTTGLKVLGGILGFIIPLVGIILFFVWRKNKRSAANVAIIAAGISIIINVIYMATSGMFA